MKLSKFDKVFDPILDFIYKKLLKKTCSSLNILNKFRKYGFNI